MLTWEHYMEYIFYGIAAIAIWMIIKVFMVLTSDREQGGDEIEERKIPSYEEVKARRKEAHHQEESVEGDEEEQHIIYNGDMTPVKKYVKEEEGIGETSEEENRTLWSGNGGGSDASGENSDEGSSDLMSRNELKIEFAREESLEEDEELVVAGESSDLECDQNGWTTKQSSRTLMTVEAEEEHLKELERQFGDGGSGDAPAEGSEGVGNDEESWKKAEPSLTDEDSLEKVGESVTEEELLVQDESVGEESVAEEEKVSEVLVVKKESVAEEKSALDEESAVEKLVNEEESVVKEELVFQEESVVEEEPVAEEESVVAKEAVTEEEWVVVKESVSGGESVEELTNKEQSVVAEESVTKEESAVKEQSVAEEESVSKLESIVYEEPAKVEDSFVREEESVAGEESPVAEESSDLECDRNFTPEETSHISARVEADLSDVKMAKEEEEEEIEFVVAEQLPGMKVLQIPTEDTEPVSTESSNSRDRSVGAGEGPNPGNAEPEGHENPKERKEMDTNFIADGDSFRNNDVTGVQEEVKGRVGSTDIERSHVNENFRNDLGNLERSIKDSTLQHDPRDAVPKAKERLFRAQSSEGDDEGEVVKREPRVWRRAPRPKSMIENRDRNFSDSSFRGMLKPRPSSRMVVGTIGHYTYEGRNLLKNNCGQDDFSHWEMKNDTNGWAIVLEAEWNEKLPTKNEFGDLLPEFDGHQSYFETVNRMCKKEQVIDLIAEGYDPEYLDISQPAIEVSEWISKRADCRSTYELRVRILDSSKVAISIFQQDHSFSNNVDTAWKKISHVFKKYGPGARYVSFSHGAVKWLGRNGCRMTGGVVRLLSSVKRV